MTLTSAWLLSGRLAKAVLPGRHIGLAPPLALGVDVGVIYTLLDDWRALLTDFDHSALERYVAWLTGAGVDRGLIGPNEIPRIWQRHIWNCAVVETLIPTSVTVADIGSGAGLPGLVLALVRPDLQVVLVESLSRRITFLNEVVGDLDLGDRVQVVHGRAESPVVRGRVGMVPVVISRAVATLDRLVVWGLPLLSADGRMLAIKGANAEVELARCAGDLRRLGVTSATVEQVSDPAVGGSATVVVLSR